MMVGPLTSQNWRENTHKNDLWKVCCYTKPLTRKGRKWVMSSFVVPKFLALPLKRDYVFWCFGPFGTLGPFCGLWAHLSSFPLFGTCLVHIIFIIYSPSSALLFFLSICNKPSSSLLFFLSIIRKIKYKPCRGSQLTNHSFHERPSASSKRVKT